MYFPILDIMKRYRIDEAVYRKFDSWLAIRRESTRKFLNPLQFAIDTGLDTELALYVFALSTKPEIGILRVRYSVECASCNRKLGAYYLYQEVPLETNCLECGCSNKSPNKDVVVWFELLQKPEKNLINSKMKQVIHDVVDPLGKAPSLRALDLENSPNTVVRGLMDRLDERCRSAR